MVGDDHNTRTLRSRTKQYRGRVLCPSYQAFFKAASTQAIKGTVEGERTEKCQLVPFKDIQM